MIRATESTAGEKPLLDRLSPDVREYLDRSRKIFDEAAQLRASVWQFEDPLREWETRVKAEQPKGRRWKTLLAECSSTVAEASRVHQAIFEKEREALPQLKAAVGKLRTLRSQEEESLPPHTFQSLGDCERTREKSAEALDRLLRISESLVRARPKATLEEILDLLDERRRHLGEANSRKAESDAYERRAFQLEPEAMPGLSEAAERAIVPEDDRTPPSLRAVSPPPVPRSGEGLRDEEWEAWLESVGGAEESPGDDPEPKSREQQEWEEAVRQANLAATEEEEEDPDGNEALSEAPRKAEEIDVNDNGKAGAAARPSLLGRIEELAEELREVQRGAEEEREEGLALMSAEIERLKAKHAEDMTLEVEARREVERELEETREADEKSLRKMREEIESLKADTGKVRKERDDLAAELEEKAEALAAAKKEAGGSAKRLEKLEKELTDLQSDLETVREEKEKSESARKDLVESAGERQRQHEKEMDALRSENEAAKETLAEELKSLRGEQEKLEEQVRTLETTKAEVEAAFREREAEIEKEGKEAIARLELEQAEEQEQAAGALAAVEEERDRALALVSTLTRRLEMAGLSGGDPEDNSTLTDELKRIRKAVWCTEGEMQSLRNLFLSFKDEVTERLDGEDRIPTKRGAELVDA